MICLKINQAVYEQLEFCLEKKQKKKKKTKTKQNKQTNKLFYLHLFSK